MSQGRILGGFIAFIGSFFIVFYAIIYLSSTEVNLTNGGINLTIGLLALIASILGIASKKAGGKFALIIGLISISFGIISFLAPALQGILLQYSWLWVQMNFNYLIFFAGITLEAILISLGGLLIIISL